MKHECCEQAGWYLKNYDDDDHGWIISIDGGYATGVQFCPWCGVRLSTAAPDAARPRCKVCGTTDHHTDASGNIVQNPPRR
jgi:hypothetical protein